MLQWKLGEDVGSTGPCAFIPFCIIDGKKINVAEVWSLPSFTVTELLPSWTPGHSLHSGSNGISEEHGHVLIPTFITHQVVYRVGLSIFYYMMSFLYLILAYLAPNHSLIHSSPSGYRALASRIVMLPLSLIVAFFFQQIHRFLNQTSPCTTTVSHTWHPWMCQWNMGPNSWIYCAKIPITKLFPYGSASPQGFSTLCTKCE